MPLLFAVLLLILVEISLFVTVGGAIGLGWTLAIILASGVLGGLVLRAQGQKTLGRMMATVSGPREALAEAGDGLLVAVAGILLILPGFLTDALGLILLVPWVRRAILRRLAAQVRRHPGSVSVHVVRAGQEWGGQEPRDAGRRGPDYAAMSEGEVIEGEVLDPLPDERPAGRHRG